MVSYAVGSEALIDPYRPATWATLERLTPRLLLLPYWQMYGELSLDE